VRDSLLVKLPYHNARITGDKSPGTRAPFMPAARKYGVNSGFPDSALD
jgi:hypothetical protein